MCPSVTHDEGPNGIGAADRRTVPEPIVLVIRAGGTRQVGDIPDRDPFGEGNGLERGGNIGVVLIERGAQGPIGNNSAALIVADARIGNDVGEAGSRGLVVDRRRAAGSLAPTYRDETAVDAFIFLENLRVGIIEPVAVACWRVASDDIP